MSSLVKIDQAVFEKIKKWNIYDNLNNKTDNSQKLKEKLTLAYGSCELIF